MNVVRQIEAIKQFFKKNLNDTFHLEYLITNANGGASPILRLMKC